LRFLRHKLGIARAPCAPQGSMMNDAARNLSRGKKSA
jgi:hypothetical protein